MNRSDVLVTGAVGQAVQFFAQVADCLGDGVVLHRVPALIPPDVARQIVVAAHAAGAGIQMAQQVVLQRRQMGVRDAMAVDHELVQAVDVAQADVTLRLNLKRPRPWHIGEDLAGSGDVRHHRHHKLLVVGQRDVVAVAQHPVDAGRQQLIVDTGAVEAGKVNDGIAVVLDVDDLEVQP